MPHLPRFRFIPLLALLLLTGCFYRSVSFEPLAVAQIEQEKRVVRSSKQVVINQVFKPKQTHTIAFHTLAKSGQRFPSGIYGEQINHQGNSILAADGSRHIPNSNDFSSLLQVDGKIFNITHFESVPGAIYLTDVQQDPQTGVLTATDSRPIDFSHVDGGWLHCAGSISPWNTHIASEEYPANAALHDPVTGKLSDTYNHMGNYYDGDLKRITPYSYGFVTEIEILDASGKTQVTKHYAMGRASIELAYVLPDERSVYITDDGTNGGFYLFVADTPKDLSSGHLYAAKWIQTEPLINGDSEKWAELAWIPLGHANNKAVKDLINQRIRFNDIFNRVEANVSASDQPLCPSDYRSVNTTDGLECLQLKPNRELAASRLETRRYAAYLGATTEFRKSEGLTYNPDNNTLYLAISEVSRGMESFTHGGKPNDKYDLGGNNHIRIGAFNKCGAVAELSLTSDDTLNSQYVARSVKPLITGRPTIARGGSEANYSPNGPHANNHCHLDGIANPDNITYLPGYHTLIIGEDTKSGHENNALWALNTKSGNLTRLLTAPYGAEITSPYWYPNINGFGYLMNVIQHPYGNEYFLPLDQPSKQQGYTGYLGPFPALN